MIELKVGNKPFRFGIGVVAVPSTSLTGEFLMFPSNGENKNKRETVLKLRNTLPLRSFSKGNHELVGGAMEGVHFRESTNFAHARLLALLDEVRQEVGEDPLVSQFSQLRGVEMVFQDRINYSVLFLVYSYLWEMNIDNSAQKCQEGKAIVMSPSNYLGMLERGEIMPRPRDIPIAHKYVQGYLGSLM